MKLVMSVVSQQRTAHRTRGAASPIQPLNLSITLAKAIIILSSLVITPNLRGNLAAAAFTARQILQRASSSRHPSVVSPSSYSVPFVGGSGNCGHFHLQNNRGRFFSATTTKARQLGDNDNSMGEKRTGPPLVDVDCNLVHPDLISLLSPPAENNNEKSEETDEDILPEFKILHHLSTIKSNVAAIITPSSTIVESKRSVQIVKSASCDSNNDDDEKKEEFTKQSNGIILRTTVGVHPYHAEEVGAPFDDDNDNDRTSSGMKQLHTLLKDVQNRKVISCIGETGLDYSEGFPDKSFQIPWFNAQLDLAFEYDLPLFVHERLAFDDTIQCIDDAIHRHSDQTIPKIIVHCFTGNKKECEEYVKRGYYLSVSGYINKNGEGNEEVRQCLRDGLIPIDKLMIETDAPYMGFDGCRAAFYEEEADLLASLNGKKRKRLLKGIYPNVPSSLPLVLQAAADTINEGRVERGEDVLSLDDLARITTRNAIEFFGLPDTILNDAKNE